ncbi:glycosyltransferase family 39 protein [Leifsonia aquatica]|uniref:glycosyltransferase family 39 protein n=1 Tax=Leifsonia aquatica TaxID=144185 RepID=UPI0028ABD5E6|nr:glycosyltransferase family 39 protein [Leifsonia aquatica]
MTTIAHEGTTSTGFALWWRRFWVPVVLVLIALGYSGTTTLLHTKALSPVDEWVYSDYLDKVPTELMVHQGEFIGPEALGRIACDGVYPYGPMGQPCGSSYNNPAKFPFAGKTSADAYTPIYFASTWAIGKVFHLIPGVSELEGWRLTGALWLAATMVMLYLVFRRFAIHPVAIIGLGTAFIVSPFSWWTYTYVSTDAPSAFFGALLLLLTLRYLSGKGSGWWIVGFSALAVLVKVTNILGVCLAALVLLLNWLWEVRRTRWTDGWRSLRPAVGRRSLGLPLFGVLAVAAAVIAQLGWLALHRALAVGPAAEQGISGPLGGKALLEQTVSFLPGTLTSNVIIAGSGGSSALPMYGWALAPLSWLCVVGVLGAFFALRMRTRLAPLVVSTAIASVLFAPMLAVVVKITTGSYFPLPARYGAVLLVAFLLMAAIQLKNRWASWIVLGYSVALGVAMVALTYQLSLH